MEQAQDKSSKTTVFIVAAASLMTAVLGAAGWFYRSRDQKQASAQYPHATPVVARAVAELRPSVTPPAETTTSQPPAQDQGSAKSHFQITLDPMEQFNEDPSKAVLHE